MKNQNAFLGSARRRFYFNSCMSVLLALITLLPGKAFCQDEAAYEEITITFNSRVAGNAEMPAVIYDNKAYLPVNDLFDFLRIKNDFSANNDSLKGFIQNPADVFSINRISNTVFYRDTLTRLHPNDLFYLNDDFYLEAGYFGRIFKMDCAFSFRSLSINFNTNVELPFMREERQEQLRRNISKLRGERRADTTLGRDFSLFRIGVVDWDAGASQLAGEYNTAARIGIGAMLAGGEANFYFNYSSRHTFSLKNQFYLWKYVNNDWKNIKQISAGRVQSPSALSLYSPLLGVQVNNTPTIQKRSFGTYLVTNTTEPNWIVELYVNDVLVDYTKADASGFFSFEVPLVYGSSNIRYKYYGPWGEEKFSEQQLNIPFMFLPYKKLEYNLTAGVQQDDKAGPYSRLQLNYGLTRRITIGSGVEYNASLQLHKMLPFITASVRVGNAAILYGEHAPGVVSKANLNYRFRRAAQLDINYTKYQPGQLVVRTSVTEEKKLTFSVPFRSKKFNGFGRLLLTNSTLAKGKLNSAELLVGGSFRSISANLSAFTVMNTERSTISKLSVTFQLPYGIRFNPQLQYDHAKNQMAMWKMDAEKRLFSACVMNLGYEKNRLIGTNGFTFGIRHSLSFAQVNATARQVKGSQLILTQNAGGSVIFDRSLKNTEARVQKNVGRGGLIILPFLDYNGNGKKDRDEPEVKGVAVKVEGAQVETDLDKGVTRVSGMEAYAKYYVSLSAQNLENPSWQIRQKLIAVVAQPNIFRRIEVPVSVAGEVAGYVYSRNGNEKEGMPRVRVNIYNTQQQLVAKTLTEEDGYFSYLGLTPGNYTAVADEEQLAKIQMKPASAAVSFTIKQSKEGDIADGIEIILISSKIK
ncbi:MAG: carboxypeptidase-like regulatory domain-containing protein [Ferruginibacter sp.]